MNDFNTDINTAINAINGGLSFIGSGTNNTLSTEAKSGQIFYNTDDASMYCFNGNSWELISTFYKHNITEELLEVLENYPNDPLAKDVRRLIELYRRGIYG